MVGPAARLAQAAVIFRRACDIRTSSFQPCRIVPLPELLCRSISVQLPNGSPCSRTPASSSLTVRPSHPSQCNGALTSVVYADWCGPCKMIAPHFERLAKENSIDKKVAFAKVNVDSQSTIAKTNGVSAMPTFKIFHNGTCVETIKGANPSDLSDAIGKATKLANTPGGRAGDVFKTPGRTLGGGNAQGGAGGGFDFGKILNILIMFVGMYLVSFFAASNKKDS